MKRKYDLFRPADLLLVAAVLLAALLLWRPWKKNNGLTAVISVGGETVCEKKLSEIKDTEYFSPAGGVVIELSPGGARFVSSCCPSQTCVKTGMLTKAGQSAACIPERVLLVLESSEPGEVDAIA